MRSDAIRKAELKYRKNNTRMMAVRFYRNTEADLLEYAESLPNFAGKVKELLKAEMEKGSK